MTFAAPIARQIWDQKYRLKQFDGTPVDETVQDTWRRIANALALAEDESVRENYAELFYDALADFKFLPAGRIIAGAGADRNVTLFNCLSGETKVLTDKGLVAIRDLTGKTARVLDANGAWTDADFHQHGRQPCAAVALSGGRGKKVRVVRATAGHRWLTVSGEKTTAELVKNDVLISAHRPEPDASSNEYRQGVLHGIIYGDGTKQDGGHFLVRLCGEKNELVKYFYNHAQFSNWTRYDMPSCQGDPAFRLNRGFAWCDLKELPAPNASLDYLTGFLRGWMATDGCVCGRSGTAILTVGQEELTWLERYGAVAGFETAWYSALSDETNFGNRKKALFNVTFHRHTMTAADFLRSKHKSSFKPDPDFEWKVSFVDAYGPDEDVFCPVVPTTGSFTLHSGIHTGNCFVMGTIPDSMDGIFTMLKEAALTMQQGGGIGYDFSTIRPKGAEVKGVAADASGPLTFMDVWDAMCRTVMSAGSRRGAMMGTMRCDHPDIEAFIDAKRDPAKLRMFNLSVLVTDDFMAAVKDDRLWPLAHEVHPGHGRDLGTVIGADGNERHVYRIVSARDLWDKIMRSTYDYAEPGVIFIDRINAANNLKYVETIASTNPCAEQPLPPYGACLLGSINLSRFVDKPFTDDALVDWSGLHDVVSTAIRMMDNVIDVTGFPLPQQASEAKNKRRVGLGVTGLADMLVMLGMTYGSADAVAFTEELMRTIAHSSYLASVMLAQEKGAFPLFNADEYLSSDFMMRMSDDLRDAIRDVGIRNSHLTSIAPTGTISLYAGNVSSGIEPIFAYGYTRKVLQPDGTKIEERVRDYAVGLYEEVSGTSEALPASFVTAQDLPPEAHLLMQAAAQRWIDSSISKTINLPREISFEDFEAVYQRAYDLGCKGCTTYRPNDVTGSVLAVEEAKPEPIAVDGDEGGACELRVDPETGQLIKSCE